MAVEGEEEGGFLEGEGDGGVREEEVEEGGVEIHFFCCGDGGAVWVFEGEVVEGGGGQPSCLETFYGEGAVNGFVEGGDEEVFAWRGGDEVGEGGYGEGDGEEGDGDAAGGT